MSGNAKKTKSVDPVLMGIDVSGEPTHQETIPATYGAGTGIYPARWLSPSYNQYAIEAPSDRPGKK